MTAFISTPLLCEYWIRNRPYKRNQPDNLSDSLPPVSKSTVRYERLAPFVTKSSLFFQIGEDTQKKSLTEIP
ncbi:hypothetical protein E0E07_03450 [Bacillus velezensis]|nr:hypothetical protein E0E07_03450 [Bacillus velezensis]TNU32104.1 hypothetical protein FH493_17500 [Bacillus velezensis]